jgi:tRNA(adenine34) deaminase
MRQCLELAKLALKHGSPPVGCIIAFDNGIIGEGIESRKSTNDSNHAEILAIRDAIANGHEHLLKDAVIYTTHEPCIMCSYLIRHYHIPIIVYGESIDYLGGATSEFSVLRAQHIPKWGSEPSIVGGVLEGECKAITAQYNEMIKYKDTHPTT